MSKFSIPVQEKMVSREESRFDQGFNGSHQTMEAEDDDTEVVKNEMPPFHWEDKNFMKQTLKALNKMRKNKQFCDVILRIGKQDIMAHRVVLAAVSPYFAELFSSDHGSRKEVEGGGIIYEMEGGFSKEALETLVDYAYTSTLNVPGELLRPVYLTASVLKLERVANECARFMASNMDLSSGLEIRSTPCVASSASCHSIATFARSNSAEETLSIKNGLSEQRSSSSNGHIDLCQDHENTNNENDLADKQGFNLVGCVDDLIASANLEQLQNNREFLALPRFCVEVLHTSREERDAVQPRPLCELVLDWAHQKWLDDDSVEIDETFMEKSTLLIMSKNNSLKDCKEVEEGSAQDSDLIQDYKKSYQHLDKPKSKKVSRRITQPQRQVQPSKPKEMLYTRQINLSEAVQSDNSEQNCWKVIVSHRLDNKSIIGVVSLDAKLIILSIVQRINVPSSNSPSMTRSCSEGSLFAVKSSSNGSRPPSTDKELYMPVTSMKYAKCAAGAVGFRGKLVVCGGYDRGECLNKVEAYDVSTNSWEKWPPMLCKRGRFDVVGLDDEFIYAVGGSNGHSEESSVEVYDPKTEKWTYGPNLPVSLSNIGLSRLHGNLYCVGGSYGSTGSKYCFKLDLASKTWSRIADLHIGRFQAAVIAFQGRIWAVGGCEGWSPLNSVEIYDPHTDAWSMGPPLSAPRRGCGIAIRKGQLIVVGGTDGSQSMCTTEILDLEDKWSLGPTMTFCRANVSVAISNDRLWAVGGFNGKDFLKTVEFLDHNSEEWTNILTIDEKTEHRNTMEGGVESIEKTVETLVIMGEDNPVENFMEKQIDETSKNDELID